MAKQLTAECQGCDTVNGPFTEMPSGLYCADCLNEMQTVTAEYTSKMGVRSEGWAITCPNCRAYYVLRFAAKPKPQTCPECSQVFGWTRPTDR